MCKLLVNQAESSSSGLNRYPQVQKDFFEVGFFESARTPVSLTSKYGNLILLIK